MAAGGFVWFPMGVSSTRSFGWVPLGVLSREEHKVFDEGGLRDWGWFYDGLKHGFVEWEMGYRGLVTRFQLCSGSLVPFRLNGMTLGGTEACETKNGQGWEALNLTTQETKKDESKPLKSTMDGGLKLGYGWSMGLKEMGPATALSLKFGGWPTATQTP